VGITDMAAAASREGGVGKGGGSVNRRGDGRAGCTPPEMDYGWFRVRGGLSRCDVLKMPRRCDVAML
jgi:hypothetical protein